MLHKQTLGIPKRAAFRDVKLGLMMNISPLVNPSPQSRRKLPKLKVVLVVDFPPNGLVFYQKSPPVNPSPQPGQCLVLLLLLLVLLLLLLLLLLLATIY